VAARRDLVIDGFQFVEHYLHFEEMILGFDHGVPA
jgi:hypothetical protein